MKNAKVYFFAASVAAAGFVLAGCHRDPASIVAQRATERWNLLVAGQPVKAYDYLSPGYRSTHTLDQYVAFIATSKVKWTAVHVTQQKCDAETCTVNVTIELTVPAIVSRAHRDLQVQTPLVEKWIASDGQWYFLPDVQISSAISDLVEPATPPTSSAPPPADGAPSFIPRPQPKSVPPQQTAPGQLQQPVQSPPPASSDGGK